jgi:TM2 domain-containing membrane protein YozV
MLKQQDVDAEEERLRELARQLPEAQRKAFYHEVKRELRDPDTYAVLNWFFVAGLHHFYLGRWIRGVIDLGVFLLGVALIIVQLTWPGIALILLVTAWELWALFRSQIIVQDWNNAVYRRLLRRYTPDTNK